METFEKIEIQAAKHIRFTEFNTTEYWSNHARWWLTNYSGDFPFLLDLRKQQQAGQHLTKRQIAGVLNSMRKAGEELNHKSLSEQISTDFDNWEQELEPLPVEASEIDPTLAAKLASITSQIKLIESNMKFVFMQTEPLTLEIKESKQQETDLVQEFTSRIENLRSIRATCEKEKLKIEQQLQELEANLKKLRNEYSLTLQQIAAEKKYSEVKAKFEELRKAQPWDEQIREYQWSDICFMLAAFMEGKSGVLNANDVGLGKTLESGAFMSLAITLFIERFGRHPRMIWLTKKSLKRSSFKELHKWVPDILKVEVEGSPETRQFQVEIAVANNALVITNYDALNTTPILNEIEWDFVFMDEVHKLKGGSINHLGQSTGTKVFENCKKLCSKATFIVPMSGSPIQNHPKEMFAYLHIFAPERFPNMRKFEREYCFGYPELKVNWEDIIKAMSDRVIRRSAAEVLTELPDKIREFRYVELTKKQREIYDQLKTEFFVWLDEQKENSLTATSILAQLTRLRQCAVLPASIQVKDELTGELHRLECWDSAKIDEAMDILEELLGMNEQVIVYSAQFNEPLAETAKRIQERFKASTEILDGSTSYKSSELEENFQSGKTKILLINLKTGGEGMNLQKSEQWKGGASHCIFLDVWYNPATQWQAEGRLHRMGQKDVVFCHYLFAENTVDAFMCQKLEEKEEMVLGIMEAKELRKNGSAWKALLTELI